MCVAHINPNIVTLFLPCSRAKLEELKLKESARAKEFQLVVAEHAEQGVHGLEAAGPLVRTRLVQLVSFWVCVMLGHVKQVLCCKL